MCMAQRVHVSLIKEKLGIFATNVSHYPSPQKKKTEEERFDEFEQGSKTHESSPGWENMLNQTRKNFEKQVLGKTCESCVLCAIFLQKRVSDEELRSTNEKVLELKEAVDKLQVSDQHYKIHISFFGVAVFLFYNIILIFFFCFVYNLLTIKERQGGLDGQWCRDRNKRK